jgi:hypothetical protein
MHKVNWRAKHEHEFIPYQVLQQALAKNGVQK